MAFDRIKNVVQKFYTHHTHQYKILETVFHETEIN